jgi:hypothetical protein
MKVLELASWLDLQKVQVKVSWLGSLLRDDDLDWTQASCSASLTKDDYLDFYSVEKKD